VVSRSALKRIGPADPDHGVHDLPTTVPFVERLLVLTTFVALAGTAVGFLADAWWMFGLVQDLRWHLVLTLIPSSIGLLLLRRLPIGALAAVGAVINLMVVVPPFLDGDDGRSVYGDSLALSFHNTKYRADLDAVVERVSDRRDDLVVLSNTDWVSHRELDRADLGGLTVIGGPRFTEDLAITVLARDPDLEVVVHRLSPRGRDWVVEVVTELDGEPIHILGAHPVSPRDAGRAARRDAMLEWVARWANDREAEVVVVGDLNATPWSRSFRGMITTGGLTDSQRMHGMQPSWPARARAVGLPIDHVLVSAGLVAVERELGPAFGSDHRMLHARVARKGHG
jgi:endonuclease/exonuclease/phosphatase (EEP) superfamily protein YafD